MQKLFIPVLLLLAAVSCQREKDFSGDGVAITVTAGIPETRTFIENDGTADDLRREAGKFVPWLRSKRHV